MKRRFIEYDLPLAEISEASAREKSIRHGHPSTLHIWWARRPLAASRATAFAALIDDPGPENPEKRKEIYELIKQITPWEAVKDGNSPAIQRAQEMLTRDNPAVFAPDVDARIRDAFEDLVAGDSVPPPGWQRETTTLHKRRRSRTRTG